MITRGKYSVNLAVRISLIYAIVGLSWIFLSDRVLAAMGLSHEVETRLQSVKGVAFVAVTTLVLYGLVSFAFRQATYARAETGRLATLLERAMGTAASAIFTWSDGDNRIELSPALRHVIGYDGRRLVHPMAFWRRIRAEDRRELFRILADPDTDEFCIVVRFATGARDPVWLQVDGLIRRDGTGRAFYVSGSVTNVTAVKTGEQKLAIAQQDLQRAEAEKLDAELKLHHALKGVVNALSRAIEMRDPYTSGHQMRVAHLSRALAEKLSLPAEMIDTIVLGALIHDIGKIRVPTELLSRPGKISENELAIIKSHTSNGNEILTGTGVPEIVRDIVLHHHEKLDGSGYPDGLSGAEISLPVRIVCVADVVEAITAFRPYRPALGVDVALKELEKGRGATYDASVVDACLTLFRREGFCFVDPLDEGLRLTDDQSG